MIIYTRRSTHKRTLHIPRWTSAVRLQVEGCRSRSRGRALYRDASRAAYVWPTSFKGRRSRTRGWCHIRVNRPAFSGTDFEYLVPLSRQITLFPRISRHVYTAKQRARISCGRITMAKTRASANSRAIVL